MTVYVAVKDMNLQVSKSKIIGTNVMFYKKDKEAKVMFGEGSKRYWGRGDSVDLLMHPFPLRYHS